MRDLPLPLALSARIAPVVVLAAAGWALTSGPFAASATPDHKSASEGQDRTRTQKQSATAPSTTTVSKTYAASPAPCTGIAVSTVKSLVPGAKTAGKEIPSTDTTVRRTCSWNALKGYDYRWLDVSYEITASDAAAQKEYKDRLAERGGGGAVPGLGSEAYSVVNLTTESKQQTREGVVIARVSNALVTVTYNGSDFETKKAPDTDVINKGAIKAAKDAVAALEDGQKS